MKKILICLLCMFICVLANAATETIKWYVDDNVYATTTCQTGGDITLPTAPTKYGYTFQGWERYQFLEYIESTGTQYIDTNFVPLIGDVFDVEYKYTTLPTSTRQEVLFSAGTGTYQLVILEANTSWYRLFSTRATSLDATLATDTWYNLHIAGDGVISTHNTTITSVPEQELDGNDTNMFVFRRRNGTSPFYGAIRKFTVTRSGTMIRNYVPAKRNSDNVVGMYDTVTDTFFTNAGTGEFIAGPVINQ